jgi:hypothetical protein
MVAWGDIVLGCRVWVAEETCWNAGPDLAHLWRSFTYLHNLGNTSAIRLDKIWLAFSTRNHRCCIRFKVKRALSLSLYVLLHLPKHKVTEITLLAAKHVILGRCASFRNPRKRSHCQLPVWVRIAYRNRSTKHVGGAWFCQDWVNSFDHFKMAMQRSFTSWY